MYYRKALELQAFLDMAKDEGDYGKFGYKLVISSSLACCANLFL
jgi:hypothetical protein